ncbi:hypothetical protein E6Q11_03770 [Candidatus Dojkabacteria bacterium]|uniref:Uncharacterized protein n=1 Tax=Candidatus Dojkabacteria bacterium TaxID=2099670 RepID=A0A5C7J5Y8_9BACT|nr:MAG: hypothetical protein E6Q11_03770 [Candidatus Dojkabacteria bacterium]
MDAEIFSGSQKRPFIYRCGNIAPFCTDSHLTTKEELCNKVVELWQHYAGFSREPFALVIEKPVIYPNSPVRHSDITNLIEFVGMLSRSFRPKWKFTPTVREWKGNKPKEETKEHIMSLLDCYSKKALERDLSCVPLLKQHNVFDALGLGVFAAEVILGRKPMPRDFYQSKANF